MMYFTHVINYNKKTQSYTKTIESFSTQDAALTRFHRAMSDIISNSDVAWGNVIVTNQNGYVIKNEYHEIVPEPEPSV